jgi:hypothetical protein
LSKTVSEKQLAANRANAQKSTGPKNRGRHGLTGAAVIMTEDNRKAATDHFRLRRAQAIEENAFEAEHPQVHEAMTQARVFDFNGKLLSAHSQ